MRAPLPRIIMIIAFAYAGIVLLMTAMQSQLVFLPEQGRRDYVMPRWQGIPVEEVTLQTADGERLRAWWIGHPSPRGAAIVFNGNAGNLSHRAGYAAMFHRLGYATLLFDYRGYGASSGSPSESGTYRDAEAVWNYVTRERGITPSGVVLLGESLGTGVASWLATRVAPRAVVLASGFTSIPDVGAEIYPWLPVRLVASISYPVLENVQKITAPILVAHSPADEIIPYAHGERVYAAAREPKTFLQLAGGHNDGFLYTREEWVAEVGRFLERAGGR